CVSGWALSPGTAARAAPRPSRTVVVSAALDGASKRTSPTPSPSRGSAQLTTERGCCGGASITEHAVCSSTRPMKLLSASDAASIAGGNVVNRYVTATWNGATAASPLPMTRPAAGHITRKGEGHRSGTVSARLTSAAVTPRPTTNQNVQAEAGLLNCAYAAAPTRPATTPPATPAASTRSGPLDRRMPLTAAPVPAVSGTASATRPSTPMAE